MPLNAHTAPEPELRDLADVGVATLDLGLYLMQANNEFLSHLGWATGQVNGRHISGMLDPSVRSRVLTQFNDLTTGRVDRFSGSFLTAHLDRPRPSGRTTALAGRGGDGAVEAVVLLLRPDTTSPDTHQPVSRKRQLSELDALVLEGVAAGRSTARLAGDLYLSRQGVEYHVGSMLRRFTCSNRPALVAKAYAQGVLLMGQWPPKVHPDCLR